MKWKIDVKKRFSDSGVADKWDLMYSEETDSLDDDNFRLRRDFTVKYVIDNYDESATLCDIGCGAAPVTLDLLRRGYNVVGLDYSSDMLSNARQRLVSENINTKPLINGNSESLPFVNESFNCAICLGVISYVENYENIIKEIQRVLKPNGTLIISFRNNHNLIMNDPVILFKHLIKKLIFRKNNKKSKIFRIGQYLDREQVLALIISNNFSYIGFEGIGFGPYSINGIRLFNGKTSIRISRLITKFANQLKLNYFIKLSSDVNILIFKKCLE